MVHRLDMKIVSVTLRHMGPDPAGKDKHSDRPSLRAASASTLMANDMLLAPGPIPDHTTSPLCSPPKTIEQLLAAGPLNATETFKNPPAGTDSFNRTKIGGEVVPCVNDCGTFVKKAVGAAWAGAMAKRLEMATNTNADKIPILNHNFRHFRRP